jgi:hypothetical protein
MKPNIERVLGMVREELPRILRMAATTFARYAAKASFPLKITKSMQRRPMRLLSKIIKGKSDVEATAQDIAQWKNGMKWKVFNTKGNRRLSQGIPFAYTRTREEALKAAKIANRGLAKSMWGANLGAVGAEIPQNIKKILGDSPNLSNLKHFNENREMQSATETSIDIKNKATAVERAAAAGAEVGSKAALNTVQHQVDNLLRSQEIKEALL